jgi:hypothetical protein
VWVALLCGAVTAWLVPLATDAAGLTPGYSLLAGLVGAFLAMLTTAWIYDRIRGGGYGC